MELQVFTNQQFGQIRVVAQDGEPWFVGKDVADVLGYKNPRKAMIDHVDEEDKGVTKCDTLGGKQNTVTINESGLYSLILSSKLPTAKKFKALGNIGRHPFNPKIRRLYCPTGNHDRRRTYGEGSACGSASD